MLIQDKETLRNEIRAAMRSIEALDLWTELPADPMAGERSAGIDALLAESSALQREAQALGIPLPSARAARAEKLFQALFLDRAPVSDATLNILLTLERLGAPLAGREFASVRASFADRPSGESLERTLALAKLCGFAGTLDPFARGADQLWAKMVGGGFSPRLAPVLSIERLQRAVQTEASLHDAQGEIMPDPHGGHVPRIVDALTRWIEQGRPRMMRAAWPVADVEHDLLMRYAILPLCEKRGLPLQLVLSGRPQRAEAQLVWARDALRRAGALRLVLVLRNPQTLRVIQGWESALTQHVFPVLAYEGAADAAIGLAGMRAAPYASGAAVLEQVIGGWICARRDISQALYDRLWPLIRMGWGVSAEEIQADAARLLGGNWEEFCK